MYFLCTAYTQSAREKETIFLIPQPPKGFQSVIVLHLMRATERSNLTFSFRIFPSTSPSPCSHKSLSLT
jgi:hypothetical protein